MIRILRTVSLVLLLPLLLAACGSPTDSPAAEGVPTEAPAAEAAPTEAPPTDAPPTEAPPTETPVPPTATSLPPTATADPAASYPNAQLLVDVAWLSEHGGDPLLRIVDVRDAEAYAAGHLPDAVNLPISDIASTINDIPLEFDGDEVQAALDRIGLTPEMTVVIYDNLGMMDSARLFWYGTSRQGVTSSGTTALGTVCSSFVASILPPFIS